MTERCKKTEKEKRGPEGQRSKDQMLKGQGSKAQGRRMGKSGVMSIEFALVLPILLCLWCGLVDISRLLLLNSRVLAAAQTGADIVSRDNCLSDVEMADVFAAMSLIIDPFDQSKATYKVESVVYDDNGAGSIDWQEANPSTGGESEDIVGTVTSMGLAGAGESVVVSYVTYNYEILVAWFLGTSVQISERAIYRPRVAQNVMREGNGVSCG
jgi:Flp pilus assembly protein TadG